MRWSRSAPNTLVLSGLSGESSSAVSSDGCVIEQNGLRAALITHLDISGIRIDRYSIFFPTLIPDPQDTRGYLQLPLDLPVIPDFPAEVSFDGISLQIKTVAPKSFRLLLFPSPMDAAVFAIYQFDEPQDPPTTRTEETTSVQLLDRENFQVWRTSQWVSPTRLEVNFSCNLQGTIQPVDEHLTSRMDRVRLWTEACHLECPVPELTTFLDFAKIRSCEAIFESQNHGLVHSPGGGMFYCGVWCNDQAEYGAVPLVLLGGADENSIPREAAINSLRVLASYFDKAEGLVPYSMEVDGGYIGNLDRGDAAMFAWGASQVVLILSDHGIMKEFLPHIEFACDILCKKVGQSPSRVVESESDELEGRFSTGEANLSVNCLAILALECSAKLANVAGREHLGSKYETTAILLRENVEEHFKSEGRHRYDYFAGCEDVRGWICLAALAGLKNGEEALLYSLQDLWSSEGVLTCSESYDVWDRCTLYAIRIAFQQGRVSLAYEKLMAYMEIRLSGTNPSPYCVENNKSFAQLSAESALFVRIFTEGLLGISPEGWRCFTISPRCPSEWPGYSLKNVKYADVTLDFEVEAHVDYTVTTIVSRGQECKVKISDKGSATLHIPGGENDSDLCVEVRDK